MNEALQARIVGPFQAPTPQEPTPRYHVIDLTRGLAAAAILVWHYQHFFLTAPGAEFPESLRSQQPLFTLIRPLYTDGYRAVQLFWLIWGFVFASVYLGREVTTRSFVVNRFARLYPLHLLTLLVVAALQAISLDWLGRWQIYTNNDLPHFGVQLLMASNWLSTSTFSFNGPIWSVSLEVLVYALFWLTRPFLYRAGLLGPAVLAALFLLATRLVPQLQVMAMTCGFYFFAGVACNLVVRQRWLTAPLLGVAGALLIASGFLIGWIVLSVPLCLAGALLLAVAIERPLGALVARRLHWIGDSTYGLYLWHVPVQIAALIVLDGVVGSRAAVTSPLFLVAFLCVVAALALLAFRLFEAPMRRRLRRLDENRRFAGEPDAGIPAP